MGAPYHDAVRHDVGVNAAHSPWPLCRVGYWLTSGDTARLAEYSCRYLGEFLIQTAIFANYDDTGRRHDYRRRLFLPPIIYRYVEADDGLLLMLATGRDI